MHGLPVFDTVRALDRLVFTYSRAGLGAHYIPHMHALFAVLFGLCVVTLILTIVRDPGTIVIPTKDELKPVGGIIVLEQSFRRQDQFL